MLLMSALTSPGCQPRVRRYLSFWRNLTVYNSRTYTSAFLVVRSSIFEPLLNPWHHSVYHFMKKPDRRRTSRVTSTRSCILIGCCEDGQRSIRSWLLTHSQIKQVACERLLSRFISR